MFSCSLCAGMCVLLREGRFLYMPKVRPRRGAASGGERRSHGAARSIAALQAARGRAQAPPSGRSRARCFARGASPPADRRSCALRCTRTCAGEAAARRGWPPLWWVLSCAMYGAARHPCVEDMQRGVVAWCGCEFARLLFCLLQHIKHDLYRIVTHSCHLADALTPLRH